MALLLPLRARTGGAAVRHHVHREARLVPGRVQGAAELAEGRRLVGPKPLHQAHVGYVLRDPVSEEVHAPAGGEHGRAALTFFTTKAQRTQRRTFFVIFVALW